MRIKINIGPNHYYIKETLGNKITLYEYLNGRLIRILRQPDRSVLGTQEINGYY